MDLKKERGGYIRYSENDVLHGALIIYDDDQGILIWSEDHQAMGAFWIGRGIYTPDLGDDGNIPIDTQFWSKHSWCGDELLTKLEPPMQSKEEVEVWMMCNPGFEEEVKKIYKHLF